MPVCLCFTNYNETGKVTKIVHACQLGRATMPWCAELPLSWDAGLVQCLRHYFRHPWLGFLCLLKDFPYHADSFPVGHIATLSQPTPSLSRAYCLATCLLGHFWPAGFPAGPASLESCLAVDPLSIFLSSSSEMPSPFPVWTWLFDMGSQVRIKSPWCLVQGDPWLWKKGELQAPFWELQQQARCASPLLEFQRVPHLFLPVSSLAHFLQAAGQLVLLFQLVQHGAVLADQITAWPLGSGHVCMQALQQAVSGS